MEEEFLSSVSLFLKDLDGICLTTPTLNLSSMDKDKAATYYTKLVPLLVLTSLSSDMEHPEDVLLLEDQEVYVLVILDLRIANTLSP